MYEFIMRCVNTTMNAGANAGVDAIADKFGNRSTYTGTRSDSSSIIVVS